MGTGNRELRWLPRRSELGGREPSSLALHACRSMIHSMVRVPVLESNSALGNNLVLAWQVQRSIP